MSRLAGGVADSLGNHVLVILAGALSTIYIYINIYIYTYIYIYIYSYGSFSFVASIRRMS